MFVLTTSKNGKKPAEPAREPFVSIDGVEYTAPVKFSPATALEFIEHQSRFGVDSATIWLLETALGVDGYQALKGFDQLRAEDLNGMIIELQTRMTGALVEGKAVSSVS